MNTHEQVNELLVDFALGELSKEQSAEVETHLAECQQCKSELKKLEAVLKCAASMKESLADEQACKSAKEKLLATVADEENRDQTPRPTIHLEVIWRLIMKSKITKLAAAAVIIVAVLFSIHQFGGPFVAGTPTFAQVIQPILQAQTAILDIIIGEEVTSVPVIHDIVCGSRIRRSMSNMQDVISIIDLEKGKILTLSTNKKEATYIDLKGMPSIPNYLNILKSLIAELQESPQFVVEELGEQEIGGHKVVGFRATNPQIELKIWADPHTAIPVRIENTQGQMKIIMKNIHFDVPTDESLFSIEVPDGYKLQQTELDLLGATEQDFIEGLRVRAEVFGDGLFPESVTLEDFLKEAPSMAKKREELKLSDEEKNTIRTKLQKHLLFIQFFNLLKGEGKWHYAGKGVKLGDANTPIFWYRPKFSQTYRVIYGDLRVEDVTPENLPEPLTPEETAKINISYQQWSKPEFVGTQEDLWHITASGQIEIFSDVTFKKGPSDAATVAITLPYSSGVMQSVTLADDPVPFTQKGDGKYELQLPLEKFLAGHNNIRCKWTLSLDQLEKADYGYRVKLQSLIPVGSYKLTVVLSPDCGLEFSRDPSQKQMVPFMCWDEPLGTQFGSCGIEVRKRK